MDGFGSCIHRHIFILSFVPQTQKSSNSMKYDCDKPIVRDDHVEERRSSDDPFSDVLEQK